MKQFEAVVFDMDGLLLDTERIALAAFFETCERLGVAAGRDLFERCIGTNRSLQREVLKNGLREQIDHLLFEQAWDGAYLERISSAPIPLKRGAMALLEHVASLKIPAAVATSTRTARAREKLQACGILERFRAVVGGEQVANSKPAPDLFLRAAKLLGVSAGACLALEDSDNGVRAAVRAGMTVVQIPDLVQPSADLLALGHIVLPSLADVASFPFARTARAASAKRGA